MELRLCVTESLNYGFINHTAYVGFQNKVVIYFGKKIKEMYYDNNIGDFIALMTSWKVLYHLTPGCRVGNID